MFDNRIFEKIDSEEKAYWLGFLYADGCIHSGEGDFRIELGLAKQDYHHLEKFKRFIGKGNKISFRTSSNSYRFNFRDKKVHQDLISLGCVPKKSLILTFPTKEQVSDTFLKPFLRGYFDGDGSFWWKNKSFGLNILSSKAFLEGLCERYLPFKNLKIYPIHYERPDKGQRIQVSSAELVQFFLNDIYADATIFLDRKYQEYLDYFATLS